MLSQTTKITAGSRRRPEVVAHLWVILLLVGLLLVCGGCGGRGARYGPGYGSQVAVRPASGDSERLLKNAHYLKLTGRPDLALKELEEAYQHNPHHLKVVNALAQGYAEVGEVERAQQIYQEALSRIGDNPVLHNNLCFSYYRAGHLKKAEECFRQALARNPHNVAARNNLGMLLCGQGRSEEARRLWQETEGEAVAAAKLTQVLAALGLGAPVGQVAAAPTPAFRPVAAAPSPGGPVGSGTVAAAPLPPVKPTPVKTSLSAPTETGTPPAEPDAVSQVAVADQPRREQSLSRPQPEPQDLKSAAIKVCNGNGMPRLAHKTRQWLTEEGFKVAGIANYRDFGVEQTTIYYRPQGERVARALKDKFFHQAKVEPEPSLPGKAEVQVILGQDLRQRKEILARLKN